MLDAGHPQGGYPVSVLVLCTGEGGGGGFGGIETVTVASVTGPSVQQEKEGGEGAPVLMHMTSPRVQQHRPPASDLTHAIPASVTPKQPTPSGQRHSAYWHEPDHAACRELCTASRFRKSVIFCLCLLRFHPISRGGYNR